MGNESIYMKETPFWMPPSELELGYSPSVEAKAAVVAAG